VIIRGRFIGGAPYFALYLRSAHFQGQVWMLADTGASRTLLLDRDLRSLNIPTIALEPTSLAIVGIGGSVRSFVVRGVDVISATDEGYESLPGQDVWAVQHDLDRLPPDEASRILRLPSVLGRDVLNRFCFTCDYRTGIVQLER